MYDVIIIGCGIIGASTAFELSKYNLKIAVLERFNDVANGATKANSAILHAGYDPVPGTLMASLNVLGAELAEKQCKDLDVERRVLPSFVLAFSEKDKSKLFELYERGQKNKVKNLEIISGDEARKRESAISLDAVAALYAPTSAIVNPWEWAIALAETAVRNNVEIYLNQTVRKIDSLQPSEESNKRFFKVKTQNNVYESRCVINAAGAYSADVFAMVGGVLKQTNFCGQYYVLDKDQGNIINSIIFQCPTEHGKGVLVTPTVHGNLLVGPDSFEVENADCVATVSPLIEQIKEKALQSVPSINFKSIIHEYAGVRPNTTVADFIIGEASECKGFINLAGMRSPALTCSPAIALKAKEIVFHILNRYGITPILKEEFVSTRKHIKFRELSNNERKKLIEENPLYSRVICRCETVTEAEIVDAIHRPVVPTTIDAIKRRCNCGMGRCQGGFCSPKIHEILSRELKISPKDIFMDEEGSYILSSTVKESSTVEENM